jgi:choline dehydrogenase-like flavoprotein
MLWVTLKLSIEPICVHYGPTDFTALTRGVSRMIDIFSVLEKNGVVGPRLDPPLDVKTPQQLEKWARSKAGTAFHWMSTAPAGVNSTVADEHFKVRGVTGLRVGSGASLPEIPGANPHLTITAFAIALAYDVVKEWGTFAKANENRSLTFSRCISNSAC